MKDALQRRKRGPVISGIFSIDGLYLATVIGMLYLEVAEIS
jgi:hypothetical protein